MIYLPDSNVFSRYLRGRPGDARLCDRLEASLAGCRLSAIVLMELEYGAAKQSSIPAFRERAHLAGLKPNAQPIGPYDALLAGQALALGAVLVTHNTREFMRVPGLSAEDWQLS